MQLNLLNYRDFLSELTVKNFIENKIIILYLLNVLQKFKKNKFLEMLWRAIFWIFKINKLMFQIGVEIIECVWR